MGRVERKPMRLTRDMRPYPQRVEQQGNIVNPTSCIWDVDDARKIMTKGILQPGELFAVTTCVICDKAEHFCGIIIGGGIRANFVGKILFSTGHELVVEPNRIIQPRKGRKRREGKGCMTTPEYAKNSNQVYPIPDSEGWGKEILVTFQIRNTGTKNASLYMKAEIGLNISYRHEEYCNLPYPLQVSGECSSKPRVCWWKS